MVQAVELAALRHEAVADRVPQARREDRPGAAVRLDPQHGRVLGVRLAARVAGRADRDVELPVGPRQHHPVGVLPARRQVVHDPLQRRERAVNVARRAVHVGDRRQVDRVAVDRDAVHHRPRGDDLRLLGAPVTVLVAQHDHVAELPPGDVDRAVVRHRDHAGVGQPLREDVDPEPVRHLQLRQAPRRRLELLGLDHVTDHGDVRALGIGQLVRGRRDGRVHALGLLRGQGREHCRQQEGGCGAGGWNGVLHGRLLVGGVQAVWSLGSAMWRCISASTVSGMMPAKATWTLFIRPLTTWALPFIMAS